MECSKCHKFPTANWNKIRDAKDAFPDQTDYPRHESCVSCHKQQFFKGSPPAICSICHTTPGPRNSARHPFPNPREIFDRSPKGKTAQSDFVIGFPHDKHIDIVAQREGSEQWFATAVFTRGPRRPAVEESCKVCHQTMSPQGTSDDEYLTKPPADLGDGYWVKKGTFKSVPTGHTTCFTCHNTDTGITPAPQDCGTCHKFKPPLTADLDPALPAKMGITERVVLDAWRKRESAGKFRHEFFAHVDLDCATCHNVQTMNTTDPLSRRVSISSCATCHATATSDDGGAINYEIDQRKANPAFECVKCHVTFGRQPVPASHLKAVSDAGGK
jgi:hypothetical protein